MSSDDFSPKDSTFNRDKSATNQQNKSALDPHVKDTGFVNSQLNPLIKLAKQKMAVDKSIIGDSHANGLRVLFTGDSGTGKTAAAELVAKELKKELYKVDLSATSTKDISETEKNVQHAFATAQDKGWLLFFDEADTLFGKRTNVKDAHDKYANNEVAALREKIENYTGHVIVAVNSNPDKDITQHFHSVIEFPPGKK